MPGFSITKDFVIEAVTSENIFDVFRNYLILV